MTTLDWIDYRSDWIARIRFRYHTKLDELLTKNQLVITGLVNFSYISFKISFNLNVRYLSPIDFIQRDESRSLESSIYHDLDSVFLKK